MRVQKLTVSNIFGNQNFKRNTVSFGDIDDEMAAEEAARNAAKIKIYGPKDPIIKIILKVTKFTIFGN